ncbi:MAG: phosphomannomutase/phosphoglucomutase [Candidatus Edwardsbacteria bacterium]
MESIDPKIFKAYDIRGIFPGELQEKIAYLVGRSFVEYLRMNDSGRQIFKVAVGQDMRLSSPVLFKNLAEGLQQQGATVIDIGLVSTDALYFAVGKLGFDGGIMITASHNPPEYNGFKMCQKEAIPLSADEGIFEIRDLVLKDNFCQRDRGSSQEFDIASAYTEHLLSFINPDKIKPFKIVVDAGNGMAGKIVPSVFSHLPCQLVPMYFELDGSFPHHIPNPIEPKNVAELKERVLLEKVDLGVAFDGDADRMFLVDENATSLGGDIVTALIAKHLLSRENKATVVYNLICSRIVPEIIERYRGKSIKSRVGHAFIKPLMRKHNAIFGGEHSGHFYFRGHWYADSGMLALLVVLELLSEEETSLSELVKEIDRYFRSGEINVRLENIPEKLKELETKYAKESAKEISRLDGLTVEFDDWWFNARPSNTEPLLRINLEARTKELLEEKQKEVLELIGNETTNKH